jgi:hypothetical protein
LSDDAASNGLIEAQFRAIVASGTTDNLQALAEPRDDKVRPAVVFLRPRLAQDDPVVDVDYTQRILLDQAGGPGGTLLVSKLGHIGHANPIQAPAAYNEAITRRVAPFLDTRPGAVDTNDDAADGIAPDGS